MVDTKLFATHAYIGTEFKVYDEANMKQRLQIYYPEDTKAMENRKTVLKHFKKYGMKEQKSMKAMGNHIELSKMWNKFISQKGKNKTCFTSKNRNITDCELRWINIDGFFKDISFDVPIMLHKINKRIGTHLWYGFQVKRVGSPNAIDVLLTGLSHSSMHNDNYMFDREGNRDKMYEWTLRSSPHCVSGGDIV